MTDNFLLLEMSDFLLLESGDKIILEVVPAPKPPAASPTARIGGGWFVMKDREMQKPHTEKIFIENGRISGIEK